MDSLASILQNKNFDEPTEVTALKSYIFDTYESLCKVQKGKDILIVTVESAGLATMIRMNQVFIKKHCCIVDRLIVRIGSI